jgi:flagellar hook protein FlgE
MYTGVSGMNAQSDALTVVSDNLANSNTVGFKSSRAVFENLIGGSISENTLGAGVRMSGAQQLFTQGTIINTGLNTDCALSGDGFFVVNGSVSGMSGTYYSRNGQFNLDANGFLVNQDKMKVQGYAFDSATQTYAAELGNIQVPTSAIAPNTTKSMTINANLDSASKVLTVADPTKTWDAQSPSTTSNFSTSMEVYDSLGNSHQMSVYFVKTADNAWDYHVLAPTSELAGGATTPTNTEVGSGSLSFSTAGVLQTATASTPISVSFAGGTTASQAIKLNLNDVTQYQESSNISSQDQDGYASGDLSGISIDSYGVVNGVYTNGKNIPMAKLSIAKFVNNQGLAKAGQNVWAQTSSSGLAALGTASSGGRASITSGALEQSNVDTTQQFVNLISHQRVFEASSKVISTSDQMLQTVVNLIR